MLPQPTLVLALPNPSRGMLSGRAEGAGLDAVSTISISMGGGELSRLQTHLVSKGETHSGAAAEPLQWVGAAGVGAGRGQAKGSPGLWDPANSASQAASQRDSKPF